VTDTVQPYADYQIVGKVVFCAGIIGDDEKGQLSHLPDQLRRIFAKLDKLLARPELAGARVVNALVFMMNIKNYDLVNEFWVSKFPVNPPARTCIGEVELPDGADIEITFTLALP
jgi:enamine deaminase RidA (YjgF/YER057c/UK114 family)